MSNVPSAWTNLSWKTRFSMSILSFGMKLSFRSDGSINRRLLNFFDIKAPPSSKPTNGVKSSDFTLDPSRNLWFRLYIPTTNGDDNAFNIPLIFYFHGGGFVLAQANSIGSDNICRRLAKQLNSAVISINYRNTPEHKYPSQIEDGFDVLSFIDNNTNFQGFPNSVNLINCFIAGDSAGGNLAHHVATKASENEFKNLKIIGVIAIQPFFGGQERTEAESRVVGAPFINVQGTDLLWRMFLPEGADRDHPAANVFGPKSKDISGLKFPATIVIVGGFDPLQDWQKRYYEGLKKAGKEAYLIEYPNAFHAFYSIPELEEASLFIDEVREFMKRQCVKRFD
ncbi:probable carboxylesterase 18 [Mangifera indica]|uniref:probable carboxylesterase 18 n=1 Tax=Mangifera indica TaxID=29780 RepID=UPI001CFB98D0|nr:probable carboxylesterase 18 [Mangifera indica]